MKKGKFLALVLSAAVMLMGAGYAAWTEKATINNIVHTGELSIALGSRGQGNEAGQTSLAGYGSGDGQQNQTGQQTQEGQQGNLDGTVVIYSKAGVVDDKYGSGTVKVDKRDKDSDNVATVNLENLYPGAIVKVTVPVTNDGTIPVSIDGDVDINEYSSWLTVNQTFAPKKLEVEGEGQTKDIVYTFTVNDNAPENASANFNIMVNYKQWNQ